MNNLNPELLHDFIIKEFKRFNTAHAFTHEYGLIKFTEYIDSYLHSYGICNNVSCSDSKIINKNIELIWSYKDFPIITELKDFTIKDICEFDEFLFINYGDRYFSQKLVNDIMVELRNYQIKYNKYITDYELNELYTELEEFISENNLGHNEFTIGNESPLNYKKEFILSDCIKIYIK